MPEGVPLNASLNVLGIAGQTAWLGLHDKHVVEGLTAAPAALHTLFDGTNTGKLLVRVGHS
jgi:NADPH-dependent curcumin reductase CurA